MTPASLFAHKLFGPITSALLILSVIGNITLGVSLYFSERSNGKLTDRIVTLSGDLRTCRTNNARLEGALSTQNTAVDGIKTAADLAAANAKLGQAAAEANAALHDKNASALGQAKPTSDDHCAAASQLIRNTISGGGK